MNIKYWNSLRYIINVKKVSCQGNNLILLIVHTYFEINNQLFVLKYKFTTYFGWQDNKKVQDFIFLEKSHKIKFSTPIFSSRLYFTNEMYSIQITYF